MNRLTRLLTFGVALSAFAALAVVPAIAQDTCCQGGTIIEGNFGGDVATTNPILSSDTASQRIVSLLYPGFVGVDPDKAVIAPNEPGAVVKDWTVSDDGLTYTFNLRTDLTWNDGTPITSADVLYAWKAIQAGTQGIVDTQSTFIIDSTGATGVKDVTAPDDHTVVVTFNNAECTALSYVGSLTPIPSHIAPADMADLNDWEGNLNPSVTAGPFNFSELRPGEQISLVGNPEYTDAIDGSVVPSGYIYKNVPDQNVDVEQFLAGEINLLDSPPVARRADIAATDAQVYKYPGNSWDYLSFNLADPSNPQNAFDDKGNPIEQGHHPIFGDVRVRQAIAHAVDVDSIIKAAVFNEGTRMASGIIPASWAYDKTLTPTAFDPAVAAQMLDEAGWIDDDGDPTTPRVAKNAMYAPDGTKFEFTLYTNDGNSRRTAIGTLVQDELNDIQIKVDFQTIDFNTLLDIMNSQTFDAIILGWRNGYPDDPDMTQLFTPASDVVNSGSDFTSYNNPTFNDLNSQAKSVPGCAPEDRAPLYAQMQKILQDDVPYVWLFATNGEYDAGAGVSGFDPRPSNLLWNADTWSVSTP